jgi:hypothetical protein
MAFCFSSSKHHSCYFTSFDLTRMFKECSMMSFNIPIISEGFHVNMALFMWRK